MYNDPFKFYILIFLYFYENCIPGNISLQFFTPFQATIWHTVVIYKNITKESTITPFGAEYIVLSEVFISSTMLLLIDIVNILIYYFFELVQVLKVKKSTVMPNFVLNSARVQNCPFSFIKWATICHSIVNPLCIFDHLVSDHHILITENRFRKKLRCQVWFHFTKENTLSFEDQKQLFLTVGLKKPGPQHLNWLRNGYNSIRTFLNSWFVFNFFIHVNFRASIIYVLVSGIVRPLFTSFIVVFLAILPCFLFQTNWKHIFWRSFTKLSGGSDSKIHKWISFNRISDFSMAALLSGVIVLSDQILNFYFFK